MHKIDPAQPTRKAINAAMPRGNFVRSFPRKIPGLTSVGDEDLSVVGLTILPLPAPTHPFSKDEMFLENNSDPDRNPISNAQKLVGARKKMPPIGARNASSAQKNHEHTPSVPESW